MNRLVDVVCHFQLSLVEPKNCDLPGVVSEIDHEIALMVFPDPRLVLGRLLEII